MILLAQLRKATDHCSKITWKPRAYKTQCQEVRPTQGERWQICKQRREEWCVAGQTVSHVDLKEGVTINRSDVMFELSLRGWWEFWHAERSRKTLQQKDSTFRSECRFQSFWNMWPFSKLPSSLFFPSIIGQIKIVKLWKKCVQYLRESIVLQVSDPPIYKEGLDSFIVRHFGGLIKEFF